MEYTAKIIWKPTHFKEYIGTFVNLDNNSHPISDPATLRQRLQETLKNIETYHPSIDIKTIKITSLTSSSFTTLSSTFTYLDQLETSYKVEPCPNPKHRKCLIIQINDCEFHSSTQHNQIMEELT